MIALPAAEAEDFYTQFSTELSQLKGKLEAYGPSQSSLEGPIKHIATAVTEPVNNRSSARASHLSPRQARQQSMTSRDTILEARRMAGDAPRSSARKMKTKTPVKVQPRRFFPEDFDDEAERRFNGSQPSNDLSGIVETREGNLETIREQDEQRGREDITESRAVESKRGADPPVERRRVPHCPRFAEKKRPAEIQPVEEERPKRPDAPDTLPLYFSADDEEEDPVVIDSAVMKDVAHEHSSTSTVSTLSGIVSSMPVLSDENRSILSAMLRDSRPCKAVDPDTLAEEKSITIRQVKDALIYFPNDESGSYSGILVRGKPHGYGTMSYSDGRTYAGQWTHGRWHGSGRAHFSNGDCFVGAYVDDQRHGVGRYEWNDGRVYDGQFVNDKRSGQGTYSWPDGAVYRGEFRDGLRHGEGSYSFADGSVYSGEWQFGKQHGFGELTWKNGKKYIGGWQHGCAHGHGVETRADGTIRYEGLWRNDRPERPRREDP